MSSWKMTLKQRRRHGELVAQLDRMKKDAYLWPPVDYVFGENEDEDEKYEKSQEAFQALVQELHELEESTK